MSQTRPSTWEVSVRFGMLQSLSGWAIQTPRKEYVTEIGAARHGNSRRLSGLRPCAGTTVIQRKISPQLDHLIRSLRYQARFVCRTVFTPSPYVRFISQSDRMCAQNRPATAAQLCHA